MEIWDLFNSKQKISVDGLNNNMGGAVFQTGIKEDKCFVYRIERSLDSREMVIRISSA